MLFNFEISDKPIKDSSFNQCLWQLNKESKGIMGKFTDLLTNSDWKSSRCCFEWKAEYIKKNRFIFILHASNLEKRFDILLPTPTLQDSRIGINNIGGSKHRAERGSVALADIALGILPTPTRSDFNARGNQPNWDGTDLVSIIHKSTNQTGKTTQLNPQFVLEMMGFPIDFTEKPFQ